MTATYNECIPLVNQLNHHDKLRLAQWLITMISQEEGVINNQLDIELSTITKKRVFGQYRHKIIIADDFDDELANNFWFGDEV